MTINLISLFLILGTLGGLIRPNIWKFLKLARLFLCGSKRKPS